jgi:carbamoyl-phosphate synthase small subunit
VSGELVFTTSMTGYQETLTDPSYRGQLVMFTYPLIGNYGVAPGRAQSECVHPGAAILATLSDSWSAPEPSGYPPDTGPLREYLLFNRVPTLYGVDTRAIAHRIRMHGAMPAVLSIHRAGCEPAICDLLTALNDCSYDTTNFIAEATVTEPTVYGKGSRLIALIDCGNKRHVIDELVRRDTQVAVLPSHTSAQDILSLAPDGVVISNGPGNPSLAADIVETVRQLYGRIPLFGICLGHQLLALAAGGRTYKLKFGHRGANHPVQECSTGRAFITTQNHGYAVDPASLPDDLLVSHRNLNDGTVEGLRHRTLPIQSLQFHPEGAPGPRDAAIVLDEWLDGVVSCEC